MNRIDFTLPVGMCLAFTTVAWAISEGKGGFMLFLSLESAVSVLVATLLVTMSGFAFNEFISGCFVAVRAAFFRSHKVEDVISEIVLVSEKIRKNGFLAFQDQISSIEHFTIFSRGIQMYIDGFAVAEVVDSANQLAITLENKSAKSVELLERAAEVAPGMGLIGTLVGLIQLLVNIKDAGAIGPSMGYALITTFYGSVLSFMFFSPLASRVQYVNAGEMLLNKIFVQSLHHIGGGKNSMQMKIILNAIAGGTLDPDTK